jgi:hypothetical protein
MNRIGVIAAAVFAVACSSSSGGSGGGGGGTQSMGGGTQSSGGGSGQMGGGAGGGGMAGPLLVNLSGTVTDIGISSSGEPVAGATVEVVGAAPANSTTTNGDGGFSLTVPADMPLFVRVSATNFQAAQQGYLLGHDAGTTQFGMLGATDLAQIGDLLFPVATFNAQDGVLLLGFSGTPTTGSVGYALSATHGQSFLVSGTPDYADAGPIGGAGTPLAVPNVAPGTTSITLLPSNGVTCTLDPALTSWRIDPNVITFVNANCH